jgi:hypothetical protein
MLGLHKFMGMVVTVGVILLQRASPCWAAETTASGVSATLYGGGGSLVVPNNEGKPDEYDVTRMGVGVLGVLRPGAPQAKRTRIDAPGFFAMLGGSFELDSSLHTVCGYNCSVPSEGRYLGKHFAARLGFGYSFPSFEFRVGALAAIPDPNVSYAMPLVIPDVLARVGRRNIGWFELGLGAYSASTNFRPGLFVGGAFGSERVLQVSAHAGLHLVNGLCCSTVNMAGYAGELSFAHAFSDSLTGSAGATLFAAEWSSITHFVAEGSARLTFAL